MPSATQVTAGQVAAQNQAIEAKLQLLEKRLADIETRERQLQEREAGSRPGVAPSAAAAARVAPVQVAPSGIAPPPGPVTATGNYPIVNPADALKAVEVNRTREAQEKKKAAADKGEKSTKAEAEKAPGEASNTTVSGSYLFRQDVPTLQSNKFELSQDALYVRNQSNFQQDRVALAVTSLRYGLADGVELGLSLPSYISQRISQTGGIGQSNTENVRAIGDLNVQLTSNIWKPDSWYPGAAFTATVVAPTASETPYYLTPLLGQGKDPRNPLATIIGSQAWGTGGNFQFFKTFDPLVLFVGVGMQYTFAKQFENFSIQPGMRYNYSAGVSFSVSEYSTLGVSLIGSFDEAIRLNGVRATIGSTEQARARFSLIQRINEDLILEPSVTAGLTIASPALTAGVGLRQKF